MNNPDPRMRKLMLAVIWLGICIVLIMFVLEARFIVDMFT